jgi:hypothetical protein
VKNKGDYPNKNLTSPVYILQQNDNNLAARGGVYSFPMPMSQLHPYFHLRLFS